MSKDMKNKIKRKSPQAEFIQPYVDGDDDSNNEENIKNKNNDGNKTNNIKESNVKKDLEPTSNDQSKINGKNNNPIPVIEPEKQLSDLFTRPPKMEDTHTRRTFLVKNELLERLDDPSDKPANFSKTKFINYAIEKVLDELEGKTNK